MRNTTQAPDWAIVIADIVATGLTESDVAQRAEVSNKAIRYLARGVQPLFHRGDALVCVMALIDSRHPPQEIDLEFINWMMDMAVPFVLVFTKADKISAAQLEKNLKVYQNTLAEFCENLPEMFTCSAKTGDGQRELLKFIRSALP